MTRVGSVTVLICLLSAGATPALALCTPSTPCRNADIQVNGTTVTISGSIAELDYERFVDRTKHLSTATVILNSDGGYLLTALQIGEYIHQKNWATHVAEVCESACSLIWMGGVPRIRTSFSRIGFHSAHYPDGQVNRVGNIAVEVYLKNIGLPNPKIAEFATSTAPEDMAYLSTFDIERLGISVTVVDPPVLATKMQPKTMPCISAKPWLCGAP
jgi:hypothetical protein